MKSFVSITLSHDKEGAPVGPSTGDRRAHQRPRADVGKRSEVHPSASLGLGCDNAKSQGDDLVNDREGGGRSCEDRGRASAGRGERGGTQGGRKGSRSGGGRGGSVRGGRGGVSGDPDQGAVGWEKGLKVHLARSNTCGLVAQSTIVKRCSVLVQSGNPLSIAVPKQRIPDNSNKISVSSDSSQSQISIRLNTMEEEAARVQVEVGVRLLIKWPAIKVG